MNEVPLKAKQRTLSPLWFLAARLKLFFKPEQILFGGIKMAIIGPYKAILKAKSLPWLMRMFP
jgi:hypothetical protein